jgi:hypothetical protein
MYIFSARVCWRLLHSKPTTFPPQSKRRVKFVISGRAGGTHALAMCRANYEKVFGILEKSGSSQKSKNFHIIIALPLAPTNSRLPNYAQVTAQLRFDASHFQLTSEFYRLPRSSSPSQINPASPGITLPFPIAAACPLAKYP